MPEVTAILYGSLRSLKSHLFYRYYAYGEPDAEVEMAYYFWLIRDGARTILVDTGFDPAVGARRGRTCLRAPLEALASVGVTPGDVSAVVVTHFHYDHIGNLGAFESAEIIVPRVELEFWTGPLAERSHYAEQVESNEVQRIERLAEGGRLRTSEGREEILPGITAITVGGHSPGQQVLVVATEDGDVVLSSDAIHFYEEFERDRPFGVMDDLAATYRAYDQLRDLTAAPGSVLVPGHDPDFARRFPGDPDTGGLASRVRAGDNQAKGRDQ